MSNKEYHILFNANAAGRIRKRTINTRLDSALYAQVEQATNALYNEVIQEDDLPWFLKEQAS